MDFDTWLYANYGLTSSQLSLDDYVIYQYEWATKTQ